MHRGAFVLSYYKAALVAHNGCARTFKLACSMGLLRSEVVLGIIAFAAAYVKAFDYVVIGGGTA